MSVNLFFGKHCFKIVPNKTDLCKFSQKKDYFLELDVALHNDYHPKCDEIVQYSFLAKKPTVKIPIIMNDDFAYVTIVIGPADTKHQSSIYRFKIYLFDISDKRYKFLNRFEKALSPPRSIEHRYEFYFLEIEKSSISEFVRFTNAHLKTTESSISIEEVIIILQSRIFCLFLIGVYTIRVANCRDLADRNEPCYNFDFKTYPQCENPVGININTYLNRRSGYRELFRCSESIRTADIDLHNPFEVQIDCMLNGSRYEEMKNKTFLLVVFRQNFDLSTIWRHWVVTFKSFKPFYHYWHQASLEKSFTRSSFRFLVFKLEAGYLRWPAINKGKVNWDFNEFLLRNELCDELVASSSLHLSSFGYH
ncbi:hypothetical protein HELRODRAFT_182975 [Helobdella robusta]|uniref:Uncharacterized protein n=1 Tax=Helobdella robusta TaxID=6412 RepID=T1FJ10_HELRO|nr:hypothetical protein HELRODRAFT_182975 [Helobdella robusta]ESN89966.1 hypothetical protein HELRODRAFT_182975 [Helobdella robusta]